MRLRVCEPLPQVKLQSPQALHADHLPLTKERKKPLMEEQFFCKQRLLNAILMA